VQRIGSRGAASILTLAVLLFATGFTAGRVTSEASVDAAWWRGLPSHDQMIAVQGAINGYEWGYSDGVVAQMLTPLAQNPVHSLLPRFPNLFETYTRGIGDYYDKHGQNADREVGEVLGCLSTVAPQRCSR
jgi:hypothetical protein